MNPNRVVVEAIPGYPVIVRAERPEEVVVMVFNSEDQEQPEAFGYSNLLAISQLHELGATWKPCPVCGWPSENCTPTKEEKS